MAEPGLNARARWAFVAEPVLVGFGPGSGRRRPTSRTARVQGRAKVAVDDLRRGEPIRLRPW